jgi:hypothetical protein
METLKLIANIVVGSLVCYAIVALESALVWRIGVFLNALLLLAFGGAFVLALVKLEPDDIDKVKLKTGWKVWFFANLGLTLTYVGFGYWGYGLLHFAAWLAILLNMISDEAIKLKAKVP